MRRRIAAGEWAVDEVLRATAALAKHYDVSQATVTRVLRVLAGEGLVRTVPALGHVPRLTGQFLQPRR